jgi:hypothetical protein
MYLTVEQFITKITPMEYLVLFLIITLLFFGLDLDCTSKCDCTSYCTNKCDCTSDSDCDCTSDCECTIDSDCDCDRDCDCECTIDRDSECTSDRDRHVDEATPPLPRKPVQMSDIDKTAIGVLIQEWMSEQLSKSNHSGSKNQETNTTISKEWVVIARQNYMPSINIYDVVDSQGKDTLVNKFNLSLLYCSSIGCRDKDCPYECHDPRRSRCDQELTPEGPGCSDGIMFDQYHHKLTHQTYAVDVDTYNKHFVSNLSDLCSARNETNETNVPTISFVVKPKHMTIRQIVNDILC